MIANFWTELERLYYYLNINNKQGQKFKRILSGITMKSLCTLLWRNGRDHKPWNSSAPPTPPNNELQSPQKGGKEGVGWISRNHFQRAHSWTSPTRQLLAAPSMTEKLLTKWGESRESCQLLKHPVHSTMVLISRSLGVLLISECVPSPMYVRRCSTLGLAFDYSGREGVEEKDRWLWTAL